MNEKVLVDAEILADLMLIRQACHALRWPFPFRSH